MDLVHMSHVYVLLIRMMKMLNDNLFDDKICRHIFSKNKLRNYQWKKLNALWSRFDGFEPPNYYEAGCEKYRPTI